MSGSYITTLILTILLQVLTLAPSWGGEQEVGIFVQQEKNCTVQDDDGATPCGKGVGVRNGDMIKTSRDPKTLNIQWISKEVKLEKRAASEYRVVYALPAEKSGIVNTVLDILGFAKSSARSTSMAATRGAKTLQPIAKSTLLSDSPVIFNGWGNSATRLLIHNEAGVIVLNEPLVKRSEVRLIPEKSGLLAGQTYHWQVEGNQSESTPFVILDAKNAAVVHDAFAAIDANAALSVNDKVFAKASAVLYLSENYRSEISLDWLAYQLVDQMQGLTTKEDKDMARYLKLRSESH